MRNLGRGGLSEAENSTKWKCYCCAPEKIKKHTEFAEVLKLSNFEIFLRLFFRNYKKQINSDQNGNKKKNEKQKSENL